MAQSKCKICRRVNEKLFLKGDRCISKCTMVKKPYRPGVQGVKMKMRKKVSEYGNQLTEKQKLKFLYGLREKQFVNYIKKALRQSGSAPANLSNFLETRLDNVIFRLGLASSRAMARQIVSHGHILVNNRKINIPSYNIKLNDIVKIREASLTNKNFTDLDIKWKKFEPPVWLALNKEKREAKAIAKVEKVEQAFNLTSIIELYSR